MHHIHAGGHLCAATQANQQNVVPPISSVTIREAAMKGDLTATLQQHLRGRLVQTSDADYDEIRALDNGMIDKKPRLIARCVDVADVIAAVTFGRDNRLLIAVGAGATTVLGWEAATTG